ncbi:MAG: DUF5063 domain-containing protein [Holophagales bacterium]|nr:DUF5063 domain-containing protein [Holophagales bacterium]
MENLRDNAVVQAFVKEVRAYIELIEAPKAVEDFPRVCATQLARLYELSMRLPETDPGETKESGVHVKLSAEIERAVGDQAYWMVFDPFEDEAPVAGSIYEDLSSVYEDVAGPLALFDRGDDDALHTAVWLWRFNMESHAGRHLIGALLPLHERATGRRG